jgi:hypothetical protein
MSASIADYWDDKRVYVYGLLGGYTQLSQGEVLTRLNELTNQKGYVETCLNLLGALEAKHKVETSNVQVKTDKYLSQIPKVESGDKITDIEVLARLPDPKRLSPFHDNITSLLNDRDAFCDELYHCLSFNVDVLEPDWFKQTLGEYLNLFKLGTLDSQKVVQPWPYSKQRLAVNKYAALGFLTSADFAEERQHMCLLETLFCLVDDGELTIEGLKLFDTEGLASKLFVIANVVPSDNFNVNVARPSTGTMTTEIQEEAKPISKLPTVKLQIDGGFAIHENDIISCNGKEINLQRRERKVAVAIMTRTTEGLYTSRDYIAENLLEDETDYKNPYGYAVNMISVARKAFQVQLNKKHDYFPSKSGLGYMFKP